MAHWDLPCWSSFCMCFSLPSWIRLAFSMLDVCDLSFYSALQCCSGIWKIRLQHNKIWILQSLVIYKSLMVPKNMEHILQIFLLWVTLSHYVLAFNRAFIMHLQTQIKAVISVKISTCVRTALQSGCLPANSLLPPTCVYQCIRVTTSFATYFLSFVAQVTTYESCFLLRLQHGLYSKKGLL